MKFALFLMTMLVTAATSLEIGGQVTGSTGNTKEDSCSHGAEPGHQEYFFDTCVLGTLREYGFPVSRRTQELRGNDRELFGCGACPSNPPAYSFCWLWCGGGYRRLTADLEDHHEERFLQKKAYIQDDVLQCLIGMSDEFKCMGDSTKLKFDLLVDGDKN